MALAFSPKYLTGKQTLVCFHSNCTDGFTSAVIAYSHFKDNADYLSVQYNKDYDIDIFKGKDVYVFDFSFPREFCLEIKQVSKSLIILDHHKTAQAELDGLDFAIFDMTKSGALMTWEFFFSNSEPPMFVKYVSDYDLWEFKYEETIPFGKFIRSIPFDLKKWFDVFKANDMKKYIEQGEAIDRFTQQQVNLQVGVAVPCIINGIKGLIVNSSACFSSEVGNKLAEKSKTFGATYVIDKDGGALMSLRSIGDFDTSSISKSFGGGGHRNASGFKIPLSKLQFVNNEVIINK